MSADRHRWQVSATRTVIDFAVGHGGIVTTREAAALGLTMTTLRRRVEDGIFVRVAAGVLALPGTATRSDLWLRIAQRHLGAVVSHQSAARMHRFQFIPDGPPTVTVSHRGTHRLPGVIVHQSTDLMEGHVQETGAHRLTTPVRTVVDLAKVLARPRLERVVDSVLAEGLVDLDDLSHLTSALARRGKKGITKLRGIISERIEDGMTESELEALLLELIDRAGLPHPVRQFRAPWLQPIEGRVDLAYLLERIVIEGDSRRWHALYDAFENDRRRDNAAQLAGWIVLRFTWRMVRDDPMAVVSTIRSALESR